MSKESVEPGEQSQDETSSDCIDSLCAIAGRIDAQRYFNELSVKLRYWIEDVHKSKIAYALYGALDGANLAYSTGSLSLELFHPGFILNKFHNFMTSPAGIVYGVLSYITLFIFGVLGNYWDDDDKNAFKRNMAIYWPYVRDVLKACKNSLKIVYNLAELNNIWCQHIGSVAVNGGLIPAVILLGMASSFNRLLYRRILDSRKKMMKDNNDYLHLIEDLKAINLKEMQEQLTALKSNNKIYEQEMGERVIGLVTYAIGGMIDSIYYYFGIFNIKMFVSAAIIPFPVLIMLFAVCCFYSLTTILTRLQDEYDFQQKLIITQEQIHFTLFKKEQEFILNHWLATGNTDALNQGIEAYLAAHSRLVDALRISYVRAILIGMKNGLLAQGAVIGIMFTVYAFCLLAGATCPPLFLLICALSGLVSLTLFATHAVYANYKANQELNAKHAALAFILNNATTTIDFDLLPYAELIPAASNEALTEFIRTSISSFTKGTKSAEFIAAYAQEMNEHGEFKNTGCILILIILSAIFHCIIFGLRALARGFGRPPIGQCNGYNLQPVVECPEDIAIRANTLYLYTDTTGDNVHYALQDKNRMTQRGILEVTEQKETIQQAIQNREPLSISDKKAVYTSLYLEGVRPIKPDELNEVTANPEPGKMESLWNGFTFFNSKPIDKADLRVASTLGSEIMCQAKF